MKIIRIHHVDYNNDCLTALPESKASFSFFSSVYSLYRTMQNPNSVQSDFSLFSSAKLAGVDLKFAIW